MTLETPIEDDVLELEYIEYEDVASKFVISEEQDIFISTRAAQPVGPAVLPPGKGSGTPAPTPSTLGRHSRWPEVWQNNRSPSSGNYLRSLHTPGKNACTAAEVPFQAPCCWMPAIFYRPATLRCFKISLPL